jgi:hypothetical protein
MTKALVNIERDEVAFNVKVISPKKKLQTVVLLQIVIEALSRCKGNAIVVEALETLKKLTVSDDPVLNHVKETKVVKLDDLKDLQIAGELKVKEEEKEDDSDDEEKKNADRKKLCDFLFGRARLNRRNAPLFLEECKENLLSKEEFEESRVVDVNIKANTLYLKKVEEQCKTNTVEKTEENTKNLNEVIIQCGHWMKTLNNKGLKVSYLLGNAIYVYQHYYANTWNEVKETFKYSRATLSNYVKLYEFLQEYKLFLFCTNTTYTKLLQHSEALRKFFENNPLIADEWRMKPQPKTRSLIDEPKQQSSNN